MTTSLITALMKPSQQEHILDLLSEPDGVGPAEPRERSTINLPPPPPPPPPFLPQIEGAAHTLHLSIWSFIYMLEANEPSQSLDDRDVNDLN